MTVLTFLLFLFLSVLINITITSFMITRTYHAKRFFAEMEQNITKITQNIDTATNEQILLAEENINMLKRTLKQAQEFYKKLEGSDYAQYSALLDQIKKLSRKTAGRSRSGADAAKESAGSAVLQQRSAAGQTLPAPLVSSTSGASSVSSRNGKRSRLLSPERDPERVTPEFARNGSTGELSEADSSQATQETQQETRKRLSLDERELLKLSH